MKIILLFSVLILALSGYVYWPLWQEFNGRAVDAEMTAKTEKAISENKIDPSYLDLAAATGGTVCSAMGNTVEEKNENLIKCFKAINHQDLKKNKTNLVRQRFLKVKQYAQVDILPVAILIWIFLFLIILVKQLGSSILVTFIGALPGFLFWIFFGGFNAVIQPEMYGRGDLSFHLPLVGSIFSGAILFVLQKLETFQDLSVSRKQVFIVITTLIGLVPAGFVLLLAGHC